MDPNCKFYCYRKTRTSNSNITHKNGLIKLVVFDMDGVLTDTISSWKYLHDYFGTCNDRSVDDYVRGKIDDLEFIRRDASLWIKDNKKLKKEKLIEILSAVPLMNGAKACVNMLKKNKIKTAIISAGFDILADRVKNELGIDYTYANGLKTDKEGYITSNGNLKVRLMYKDKNVLDISKKLGLSTTNIAAVGNSCFDIPMFETSGLGIAFNPSDECVCEAAEHIIKEKNLNLVSSILDGYIKKPAMRYE